MHTSKWKKAAWEATYCVTPTTWQPGKSYRDSNRSSAALGSAENGRSDPQGGDTALMDSGHRAFVKIYRIVQHKGLSPDVHYELQ